MKKLLITFALVLCVVAYSNAQTDMDTMEADTVVVDTLKPINNMLGINVFPIFGMIGGGGLPSNKICLQYKRMWENWNLKFGANYTTFLDNNTRVDIVNFPAANDTVTMRQYSNNYYSFDGRIGFEHVHRNAGFSFYYGMDLIGGYHYKGKNYYDYSKGVDTEGMVEHVQSKGDIDPSASYTSTWLKGGMDIVLGLDFLIDDNVCISVQYTPEMCYFYNLEEENDDPAVFDALSDTWDFQSYIDLMLSVQF